MIKRAQGRKRFGRKNFKQRYFKLTTQDLSYSKTKGILYSISLNNRLIFKNIFKELYI